MQICIHFFLFFVLTRIHAKTTKVKLNKNQYHRNFSRYSCIILAVYLPYKLTCFQSVIANLYLFMFFRAQLFLRLPVYDKNRFYRLLLLQLYGCELLRTAPPFS